jgi:hypothetical protein
MLNTIACKLAACKLAEAWFLPDEIRRGKSPGGSVLLRYNQASPGDDAKNNQEGKRFLGVTYVKRMLRGGQLQRSAGDDHVFFDGQSDEVAAVL